MKDVVLNKLKKELIISKNDFKKCFNKNIIVDKEKVLKYYKENGKN